MRHRPAAIAFALLTAGASAFGVEPGPAALELSALAVGAPLHGLAALRPPALPARTLLPPLYTQRTDYSCGAATLLSVLRHRTNFAGGERDLYAALGTTPKDGTEPVKIAEVARGFGLSAEVAEAMTVDALRAALAAGKSVILDIQAWRDDARTPWRDRWEDGHYIILVGLDGTNAYAMDPVLEGHYGYLPIGELLERWHDYEGHGETLRRYRNLGVLIEGGRPIRAGAVPARLGRIR